MAKSVAIDRFTGIANVPDPAAVGFGGFVKAVNVDIDDVGKTISRRSGFTLRTALVGAADIFSDGETCLLTAGGSLHEYDPITGATTLLRSGLSSGVMRYLSLFGRIFWTNSFESGVVENGSNRNLGIASPQNNPTLATSFGNLRAGRYLVAVTYLRSDGQESGSLRPELIILPTPGGIAMSAIPVSPDPDVVTVNIYASTWNGEELYLAGSVSNGVTTFTHDQEPIGTSLTTLLMGPPPAGQIIEYHAGRLWICQGRYAWYSPPYDPENVDYAGFGYIDLGSHITLFRSVAEGLWVSTQVGTSFIYGLDPENPEAFMFRKKESFAAIEGSDCLVDGRRIGPEGISGGMTPAWLSTDGWRAGGQSGDLIPLSRDFRPEIGSFANAVTIEDGGSVRALVTIQGDTSAPNVSTSAPTTQIIKPY